MHILFISIAWPEPGQKNLYTDLMQEFIRNGNIIDVVGTQSSDKETKFELRKENEINVLRVYSPMIRKASYFRKIVSLLTLGSRLREAIENTFKDKQYNLIIAPTPPITLSGLYVRLKRKYAAPFYLLLKDIWPQGSVDLGVFRRNSLPWWYFRKHEIRIYKTADYIGCMSPKGVEYVRNKNQFIATDKIEVCPNSICPIHKDLIRSENDRSIREKYNIPQEACVFIFSGNLGIGHGLHFALEAISNMADYPKAFFIFGGSGTQYKYLEQRLAETKLANVLLYSWLPSEDYKKIMATVDVGLIFLYKYTSPQFPSRLLSYLEFSKPVLCAVNNSTDIGAIVESSGCGLSVDHGDIEAFISAVKSFSDDQMSRENMGKLGRTLLEDQYTVSHSYNIIMSHFE